MMIWRNKRFPRWETVTIVTGPAQVVEFIRDLELYAPSALRFVKIAEENLGYSKYRGTVHEPSVLVVQKKFADQIGLKGSFGYLNKGWGDVVASLQYDLSRYSKVREFTLKK